LPQFGRRTGCRFGDRGTAADASISLAEASEIHRIARD
jgi:hypothetical protein